MQNGLNMIKQYYIINNMKKASLDAKWLDVRGVSTGPSKPVFAA